MAPSVVLCGFLTLVVLLSDQHIHAQTNPGMNPVRPARYVAAPQAALPGPTNSQGVPEAIP
ncbi:MAG: hypothetical protein AAGG44_21400, partial [Planctomycetota bacterium]